MNSRKSRTVATVIVPAFNEERYIGRCLRSLTSQRINPDHLEIIVVDDGSTDHTSEIVADFGERVKLISNPVNLGLPASLNKAIKACRSPFFVRVDADDYVNEAFVDVLMMFLGANPTIDAVACEYLLVDDREDVLSRVSAVDHPIACGIMFRTDQIIDLGLYDESFLMHEDRDLRIRFLKQYSIHHVPLPLYRYRRHGENMTNDANGMAHHMDRLVKKHGDL